MTPDRWKRIEALYNAASVVSPDERGALLATACPDDDALRREVEALLNEPIADDGFLAPRALAKAAAQLVSDLAPEANVGRTLGSYVLQRLLGVGGMGVVYAARDTRLARDVAIKILPREFTSNPDRLARFEREARMLAAVNHPNICAIYGLEETDGIRYLVLELVDGQTLADVAQRDVQPGNPTGLEMSDALRIGRQIVDALEAAHERGIVHRDLKPANITVTSTGVVKVLDFGLAKVTDDAPPPAGGTRDGLILGTAAYMSPEQARGKAVDKRADIWAFGCILYELLTGRLAFQGETDSDIIGRILEREPDWSALPTATPAAIRRLLLRCLAKDPRQRLRDVGDVRIELDRIDDVLPGVTNDVAPSRVVTTRTWLPWIAVITVVAAVVAVFETERASPLLDNPLANARFSRITNWDGDESSAEISPDGKWVAFFSDRAGQMDLWLCQLATGRFQNLTEGIRPRLGSAQAVVTGPIIRRVGFSGDSSQVWFEMPGQDGYRLMPLIGAGSQPFLSRKDGAPSWSTDDARVVYFNASGGDPLFVADRAGADARRIAVTQKATAPFFAPNIHNHNPIWSSDNQWIYLAHGAYPSDDMDVWRVRPSGGSPEQMTDQHADINFLAPLDVRTLLYVARGKDGAGPWLWALDVERKLARRVTTGLEQYTTVSASRDGRRVVATVANPTATLWQVPVLDRLAEDRDVQAYQLPSARAFAPRFGGTSLFYLSGRGAGDGLWRYQDGQTSEVWKGADVALSEPPAVSPDGTRVAVVVRQGGKRHLTIMSADGTNVRTLAESIDIKGEASHGMADWSPDGAWIVAGGSDENGPGLFKIPVDGGDPIRLTAGPAINPVWSPDGTLIVYAGVADGNMVPVLGIRPDGTTVDLPAVQAKLGGSYRFLRNGTGLVYLTRPPNFWLLDFSTMTTRQLTRLSNLVSVRTFDVTPDGKQIVFDRTRQNSDVVLIEVPR